MLNLLITITMPPLLVFGLYHLLTWVNLLNVNARAFWKRVALASALSHLLLAAGFFVFTYFDYRANRELTEFGSSYGEFLFNRSEYWRLVTIFDTGAMGVVIVMFSLLALFDLQVPGVVGVTIVLTLLVGTLQWYFVGGGVGALLERFWSGLKTSDEEEWFT